MTEQRTAVISTESQDAHYYDIDGNKKRLGTVLIDTIQGEGVKRQFFIPDDGSPYRQETNSDKRYNLGLGSDKLTFIDPALAVEPLLEMGWKIKNVLAHRGGSEIMTTLVNPGITFRDPIEYDKSRWLAEDVHGEKFISTISTCLTVRSNLHIGFVGAHYSGGLYRLVCSNLAEAEVLGLPSYSYRHNFWKVETVAENLARLGYTMNNLEQLPTGPVVGTIKTIAGIRTALAAYRDEIQGFKPKSGMFDHLPKQFSYFNPVKMPDWSLNNFLAELQVLEESFEPDYQVSALMILNAYTNAINWHNQAVKKIDRGTWNAIANASDVVGAITEVGKFISFFSPDNYLEPINVYSDLNTTGAVPKRKGYKVIEVKPVEIGNIELPKLPENVSFEDLKDKTEQFNQLADQLMAENPEIEPSTEIDEDGLEKEYVEEEDLVEENDPDDIPVIVLDALSGVRESGAINMFDRKGVIHLVKDFDEEAGEWLETNLDRYMDALNGMADLDKETQAAQTKEEKTTDLPTQTENASAVAPDVFNQLNEQLNNL